MNILHMLIGTSQQLRQCSAFLSFVQIYQINRVLRDVLLINLTKIIRLNVKPASRASIKLFRAIFVRRFDYLVDMIEKLSPNSDVHIQTHNLY